MNTTTKDFNEVTDPALRHNTKAILSLVNGLTLLALDDDDGYFQAIVALGEISNKCQEIMHSLVELEEI